MRIIERFFASFRTTYPRRWVDGGRVSCPRRGDIAADLCSQCPDLVDSDLSAPRPWIECRPSGPFNGEIYNIEGL